MPDKINVRGEELTVRDEPYEIVNEGWNEYRLKDGTRVRVKDVVSRIGRVLDSAGEPAVTAENTPHVVVKHRTLIEVG